jgi:hypothetical protein
MQCLDEVEMKKFGNTDFVSRVSLQWEYWTLWRLTAAFFGKLGFPLGHLQVQSLAHEAARKILQERVKAGKMDSFIDLAENIRCKKTDELGSLPVCGETWFRGCFFCPSRRKSPGHQCIFESGSGTSSGKTLGFSSQVVCLGSARKKRMNRPLSTSRQW